MEALIKANDRKIISRYGKLKGWDVCNSLGLQSCGDVYVLRDYIDASSFIDFLSIINRYVKDIDIMLEAKAKDESLFRLVRELKYKTNYKFLDETSFKVL